MRLSLLTNLERCTDASTRKWVKYEIEKAYELNKGIVGIFIHNLEDKSGNQTDKGANPFYSVFTNDGERLSNFVTCFDSIYCLSKNVYADIAENIEDLIEVNVLKQQSINMI